MSEDEDPNFRNVPIPPGNRTFWLGAITILIIGAVGVGGQLVGLRAIDALSKAEIRLEAIEDEERQIRLAIPRLATERELLKNEHAAAEDLLETRKAQLELLASKIAKASEELAEEQSLLAIVRREANATAALEKQQGDLEASLRELTIKTEEKTAALKERRLQEAKLDATREENRSLYDQFKEDREELAVDLERLRKDRDAVETDLSNRRIALQSLESDIEAKQELQDLQRQSIAEWELKSSELTQIRTAIDGERLEVVRLESEKSDLIIEVAQLQSERDTLVKQMGSADKAAMSKRESLARDTARLQAEQSAFQKEIDQLLVTKVALGNDIAELERAELSAQARLSNANRKTIAKETEFEEIQGKLRIAKSSLEDTEIRSTQLQTKTLEGFDRALKKLVDFVKQLESLESLPSPPEQTKPLEEPTS